MRRRKGCRRRGTLVYVSTWSCGREFELTRTSPLVLDDGDDVATEVLGEVVVEEVIERDEAGV